MSTTTLTPQILSGGYAITRGGRYKIEENVSFLGRLGLEIAASNVLLDLGNYIMSGGILTNSVIRIRKEQRNVTITGTLGQVKGGISAVAIGNSCRNIKLESLKVYGFYYAGIVIRASFGVTLTNCSIGRAAAAPAGTVFGVIALPNGGFAGASRIMNDQNISNIKATGGDGLTFRRVDIFDITPLSKQDLKEQLRTEADKNCCFGSLQDKARKKRLAEAEPSIVTIGGFMQNTSCPRPELALNLTDNLQQRVSVLGSAYSEELALLEREFNSMNFKNLVELVGAGAHAYSSFNWKNVVGVGRGSDLTIAPPSVLPKEFQIRNEYDSKFGTRSTMLIKNTILPPSIEEVLVEKTELSKVPLGVINVQVRQQSSVVGPYIPGAMGSAIIC